MAKYARLIMHFRNVKCLAVLCEASGCRRLDSDVATVEARNFCESIPADGGVLSLRFANSPHKPGPEQL